MIPEMVQRRTETISVSLIQLDLLLGTTPDVSTFCLYNVATCYQTSQAFPFRICILQVINYWRWEWPGNEVTLIMIISL